MSERHSMTTFELSGPVEFDRTLRVAVGCKTNQSEPKLLIKIGQPGRSTYVTDELTCKRER